MLSVHCDNKNGVIGRNSGGRVELSGRSEQVLESLEVQKSDNPEDLNGAEWSPNSA